MKFLLPVLMAAFVPMFATHAEEALEADKAAAVLNIDKRIESLQKFKTCIQPATTRDAVSACRKAHKAEMDVIVDAKIDAKIQRLQQRKEKNKHE